MGLFGKAKTKKYHNIVDMDTPYDAVGSVNQLEQQFRDASTKAKKERIREVAQGTANRAKAIRKRKNLSPKEKQQFKEVENIYRRAAEKFDREVA